MICYEFLLETPLKYNFTGKFQAPSSEWRHFTRYMEDYELIVVTEGTVYIQEGNEQFALEKGEFKIFAPGSRQSGYKNSSCAFYWMHFEDINPVRKVDIENQFDEFPENKIYVPTSGKIKNLEKIIIMMKHLQDCIRSYHNKMQNDYMSCTILCEISSQFMVKQNQENSDLKKKQLFNDIQDYVKWNRNSDIKVSEIAEHFGYNKRYLSYVFSTIAGVPLKQYILQEKIDLAKYILCDTNDTISEVAYQIGFNDSHNFMKIFKKIVGMTPTQYRNAYDKRMLYYK
ncbi:AraC family transcriptional regulator [Clostridium oryzae]|uniref:Melibiose operon regulatory protein n=1 Tax=Clostridium oryzae TaxID=1450648 RepID=A0A1V4ICM8_9CLOT|nr:AraC family transcriptional regulator [Clostridium oryzae]OPJ57731.1 melibiose operon regulatory protein [Clostridium oryzae]